MLARPVALWAYCTCPSEAGPARWGWPKRTAGASTVFFHVPDVHLPGPGPRRPFPYISSLMEKATVVLLNYLEWEVRRFRGAVLHREIRGLVSFLKRWDAPTVVREWRERLEAATDRGCLPGKGEVPQVRDSHSYCTSMAPLRI